MPPRRGRAKQIAAPRPSRLDDAVFFGFVEYLRTIPDDETPQRPVKRARIDTTDSVDTSDTLDATGIASAANGVNGASSADSANSAHDYVPVARRSYTFSRSTGALKGRISADPLRLENAHSFFDIRFSGKTGMTFSLRRRPAPPGLRSVVFPGQEFGPLEPADWVVLAVLQDTEPMPPENGRFWAFVSLTVDHTRNHTTRLTVDIELRWNTSAWVDSNLHSTPERERRRAVLEAFFPEVLRSFRPAGKRNTWSPQIFYEAAHVTNADDRDEVHVPGLTANLFPFQNRAVKWLLQREGVRWAPEAAQSTQADPHEPSVVVPDRPPPCPETTAHFVRVEDADGMPFYISSLFGVSVRDPAVFEASEAALRGGILSEEMGLGKTVEVISLVLLHPRPSAPSLSTLPGKDGLRTTGATLIVTPPALESQWVSELRQHAPHLRVMVYKGVPIPSFDEDEEADMVEQMAEHDVVITTYSALAGELHFAVEPPARSMRFERKYRRARSPLTQLSWWRVCIDEAQEIESGVSGPAATLRTISRVNAWAITGTPVKNNVEDLWGLLLFLYYEPYASNTSIWRHLLHDYQDIFRELFGRIALRHSKRAVGDELVIPPQKRYVITTPFSAVEEQHYQTLFKQLTEACGLDTSGAPLADNWDPDDPSVLESMRVALNRLRQTALHPEIGERNRKALGNRTAGPMRTVAEVLDAMIEQSGSALLVDKRALLSQKLKHGQLLENSPRAKEALAIWQGVLEESKALVQEARDKLAAELEKAIKAEPAGYNKSEGSRNAGGEKDIDNDSLDDKGNDNDDEKTVNRPVTEAQRELRYALEILHKAEFFCANGFFQVKSNEDWTAADSDEFRRLEKLETEAYERAKQVRREILHENRSRAMRLMADLAGKADLQGFVSIPECAFPEPAGIEGRGFADELDRIGSVLNEQAAQMDDWREAVIQLLLKDLVDDDDDDDKKGTQDETETANGGGGAAAEITGDEYEDSTKVQDEIQAYITILKAGISDRNAILTGQAPSQLALYEERQARRMAEDGEGPAPELMLRLFRERSAVLRGTNGDASADADANANPATDGIDMRSLRAVIVELREASVRLRHQASDGSHRARMELGGIEALMALAQEEQTGQTKVIAGLEKETNGVRNALNARIEYYRQLQLVSDMVALYEGAKDDNTIRATVQEEERLGHDLTTAESKHRYLLHLKEMDTQEESRMCVICQSPFSIGVLTVCGHQFCKECITLWFRANHNCPMCKRKLKPANLYDITLKPKEYRVESEGSHDDGEDTRHEEQQQLAPGKKTGIYTSFSAEKLDEIRNIDLPGQAFTTKVDMLVRHILWLRSSDPGAKSIVFSQYPAFLTILGEAFREHRIGFSKYAETNGIQRFREDPSTECFLLHARAHASGLNLVNASHVILCEPLLNTALELQAIARVHRIGQQNETTVWLYIVDGTVEESIYNLSVQRRMEHMGRQQRTTNTKGKKKQKASVLETPSSTSTPTKESTPELLDSNLELANSLELQQAQLSKLMSKGPMGGEEVAKADLWTCLFGKAGGDGVGSSSSSSQQGNRAIDERLREDPVVRRNLTASAAEERRQQ